MDISKYGGQKEYINVERLDLNTIIFIYFSEISLIAGFQGLTNSRGE
jgi:hypothetical protein